MQIAALLEGAEPSGASHAATKTEIGVMVEVPRKSKWVPTGYRIMDNAFLRDGENEHSGEALVLAVILHAKGKTKRGDEEVRHVARMFNDPNLKK